MIKMGLDSFEINPDQVWSVANGRIKTIDLTTDTLSDFEAFKQQAEALYGTDQDPYRTADGKSSVVYGYRLTDVDPASWLPQWREPDGGASQAQATKDESDTNDLSQRMQALFSVNNETGPDQAKWASRVFQDWLNTKAGQTPSPIDTTV